MVAAILRAVGHRLAADLNPRSRAGEYRQLLISARDLGYRMVPLSEFWRSAQEGNAGGAEPTLILRHDADLRDRVGNELFHDIEVDVGARATYYFRLGTVGVHRDLVGQLLAGGFEVGYHYEEAALIARRRGVRSREGLLERREEIVDLFLANVHLFRQRWNPDLRSAASHGDWLNRRLKTANLEFIDDGVLESARLEFEAFGHEVMSNVDVYLSDAAPAPERWRNGYGLEAALRDGRSPIYLLTHERQWHGAPATKGREDASRLVEEVDYRLRSARARMR
jgi:hypothetical protein